ncbi:MAG TPA: trypsin-like peptidase domain-containing protein [Chloroflexaceae bacterium]|nr:trypsin-like peptidase domain-containing protein [Chloroflexaceae bacterium]
MVSIAEAGPASLIGVAAATLAARARGSVVQVRGRGRGGGSGVAWRDGQTVMTNFHVVAGVGERVEILTAGEARHAARLIAGNPRLDLALLAVEGAALEPAPVGDSAGLRVGELVFAVGNPWGQRGVVTAGIVSGVGEIPGGRDEQPASYIRSDVRLAPGNSGGPLLNARGEVVGINAMIFGGDLSVAIPSHVAAAWVARLPARPVFLGLGVQPAELPAGAGASGQRTGLLVAQLAPGGPAAAAGVLVGDLLVALDGRPLADSEALLEALAERSPGDVVRLDLARGGRPATLAATLAGRV